MTNLDRNDFNTEAQRTQSYTENGSIGESGRKARAVSGRAE